MCNSQSSLTPITNCLNHYEEGGSVKCAHCALNYVIAQDSLSCVSTCIDTIYFQAYDYSTSIFKDMLYSKCKNTYPAGCEVATIDARTKDQVCLRCKTGYVATLACSSSLSLFPANVNVSSHIASDIGASYATVECTQEGNATFFPSSGLGRQNCRVWEQVGGNFFCKQCIFGKNGEVFEDNNQTYVNCGDFLGCSTSVQYGGASFDYKLDQFWGFTIPHVFSCNQCQNSGQIPFTFLTNKGELSTFNLSELIPSSSASPNGMVNGCYEPTASALQVSSWTGSFPNNCGLGFFTVDKEKKYEPGKPTIYCLACKPGYSRSFTSGFLVTGCHAIANCNMNAQQSWFNHCSECNSGFVWSYSNNKVQFDQCLLHSDANCLAAVNSSSVCSQCKKGFLLNSNGVCDQISHALCGEFNPQKQLQHNSSDVIHQGFLY
ncbi:MAG: hypothetical protein GY938_31800 [Ketobacter sp.]|nr:hypothetical protein [Ketobacter sp.]